MQLIGYFDIASADPFAVTATHPLHQSPCACG